MLSKLLVFLFLSPLTTLGLSMCNGGGKSTTSTPVPSSVSYETAIKAVGELAETVKEQGKLIEELIATSGSTLKLVTELQSAVEKVEEFRASNPEIHRRLTENSSDKLMFQCSGYVQVYGLADLFKLGSRTLFCTQPGIARPLDGAACYNVPNTRIWDCGTGQVLMECIYCGCATPTAVPPTGVPPTYTAVPPTAVPPTGVPPTYTAVPPTAVPPTGVPPTWTPPTSQPTPEGTKECEDCPSPYGMDEITKKVEELGDKGYGFWVKEGRGQADACAFEHRENGSGNVFKFTCAKGLVCTVDSLDGYFVVLGTGQELKGNRAATIRWMPSYPNEDFCHVYEGEYCNSLDNKEWGKLPSPVGASCPTPSPERCRIRNGP